MTMGATFRLNITRAMALIALAVQVFLPSALAVAESRGFDVAKFLCAPTVTVSEEAKSAVQDLLNLIESKTDNDETLSETQCSHCTLSHIAVFALTSTPLELIGTADNERVPDLAAVISHLSRGPPLGSRAPPFHI